MQDAASSTYKDLGRMKIRPFFIGVRDSSSGRLPFFSGVSTASCPRALCFLLRTLPVLLLASIPSNSMSNNAPPFDPPYYSLVEGGHGRQHTETLSDGSTRPVDWQPPDLSASRTSFPSPTKTTPSPKTGASGAVMYLKVPFAEKEEAKALGARWDAAKKKWYVPAGKDPEPFSQWAMDQ
jgi:hypothetical protein